MTPMLSYDKAHTNIRKFREKAGLTQAMMAEELGIGRTTYINFETGRVNIFGKTLTLFARYFSVSEEEVIAAGVSDGELRERESFEDEKKAIIEDYENRLSVLREKIGTMDRIIKAHELTIKTLTDTNSYLMSRLKDE